MKTDSGIDPLQRGRDIAKRVEQFIREQVIPYEHDARQGHMVRRKTWSLNCAKWRGQPD